MTRNEYLFILRKHLQGLNPDEIDDIIIDVASHFDFGTEEGKTEDEICIELGDPVDMAQQFTNRSDQHNSNKTQTRHNQSSDTLLKIVRIIGYLFAGMFVVPLVFSAYIVLFAFIFTGVVFCLSSVLVIISPALSVMLPAGIISTVGILETVLLTLGLLSLGFGTAWLSILGLRVLNRFVKNTMNALSRSLNGASL